MLANKKADVDDNKRVEPLCDTDAESSEQQRRGQRRGERSCVPAAVKLLTQTLSSVRWPEGHGELCRTKTWQKHVMYDPSRVAGIQNEIERSTLT